MPYQVHSSERDALDVELLFPGDRLPVAAGPTLRSTGWRGGQFVQYVTGVTDYTVEVSDGNAACGFLLFQSENYTRSSPSNWTSQQFRSGVGGQNVLTMICGSTRALFRVFETEALAAGTRTGGPITYNLNDHLRISENGLLCNDSEAELIAAGIAEPIFVGFCSVVPTDSNENRLGIDLKF